MKPDTRFLRRSALVIAIAGISTSASAAFFQIAENSPSGLGNAFAGGAAAAEDASTVWYNPAGMTRLKGPQFVVGGHFIDPSFKATVNSASAATGLPIGGGGGEAGESAIVPNIYYTHALSNSFSVGAGINAPFGLATEYDSTWAGRYHAIRSDIKTVNVNLAGAYKISETLSAGAGINYQKLDAELTQAIDFATICSSPLVGQIATCGVLAGFNNTNNPNDGKAKVTADSTAFGYNLGLMAQVQDNFRVGVAYRSKMKHKLDGTFEPTVPTPAAPAGAAAATAAVATGAGIVPSGLKTDITLPSTLSFSAHLQLDSQWALMTDITRTNWSALPELRIRFDSTQPNSVVTLNLIDTYRYSIGASYKLNNSWVFRGGVAQDQSPVTSVVDRTPRLPDADRTWYTVGAGLQATPALSFDFGFAYIKLDSAEIRKTVASPENAARGNLSVDYKGTVQVLSAQARWVF
jgi:long-chain fatty acid transport protein